MTASSALRSAVAPSRERAEHELDLLEGAIAQVASGVASRVVLVLAGDEPLVDRARPRTGRRAVLLREALGADGGREIVVEPAP
jgi:hypothetical protein